MVVFGTRNKRLEIVDDRMYKCPKCSGGPLAHNIFQEYFHIWYIPFFPIRKKVVAKCVNCGSEIQQEQLSPVAVEQAKMSSTKRAPLQLYSGLFIVGLIIASVAIITVENGRKQKNFLSNPKPGDVYLVEDKSSGYSYFRVEKITGDSMLMNPNSAWFPDKKNASLSYGSFDKEVRQWKYWSREEFEMLRTSGRIDDVSRTGLTSGMLDEISTETGSSDEKPASSSSGEDGPAVPAAH